MDALRFLSLFRNAGTARNYMGYVRWACRFGGLDTAWFTDEVTMTLKGIKKQMIEKTLGELKLRYLMSDELMLQLCSLTFDLIGKYLSGTLYLVSYEFLLRVANEGIPLEKGTPEDVLTLPEGRHSAVVVSTPAEGVPELIIRLRTRKHRPQGSVLRRTCTC